MLLKEGGSQVIPKKEFLLFRSDAQGEGFSLNHNRAFRGRGARDGEGRLK